MSEPPDERPASQPPTTPSRQASSGPRASTTTPASTWPARWPASTAGAARTAPRKQQRKPDRGADTGKRGSGAHPDDRDPQTARHHPRPAGRRPGLGDGPQVHGVFGRWADHRRRRGRRSTAQPESFADGQARGPHRLDGLGDPAADARADRSYAASTRSSGTASVTLIEVEGPHLPTWKKGRLSSATAAVRATPTADPTAAPGPPFCRSAGLADVWGPIRPPPRAAGCGPDEAAESAHFRPRLPPFPGSHAWIPGRLTGNMGDWVARSPKPRPSAMSRSPTEEVRVPEHDEVAQQSDEHPHRASRTGVRANTRPAEGSTYDASAIQVLEGLEAVRKRPGMYIGSTGERGLHHLIWEIVDNAVDEALAGYCDRIVLTLPPTAASGSRTTAAASRPTPRPARSMPAVTIALTMLHAGGKFGGGGYKVSGGLHGVGVSVVNALSSRLVVEVKNRGHLWRQSFQLGVPDGAARAGPPAGARRGHRHHGHLLGQRGHLRDHDVLPRDDHQPDPRDSLPQQGPRDRGPRRAPGRRRASPTRSRTTPSPTPSTRPDRRDPPRRGRRHRADLQVRPRPRRLRRAPQPAQGQGQPDGHQLRGGDARRAPSTT